MRKILLCMIASSAFALHASTCIITSINWHYPSPDGEGNIYGTSTFTYCYETIGGTGSGGGTSSGSGSSGGGSTGGTTQPPDCVVSNPSQLVDNLTDIVEDFEGYRPFGDDPETPNGFHNGTDLFVENGTPVRAPCSGKIIQAFDSVPRNSNYGTTGNENAPGNYIVIQPPGAERYEPEDRAFYPKPDAAYHVTLDHLDPGFIETFGTRSLSYVEKGQIIGFSDNTGNSNIQPHLHISVKDGDGNFVDLLEILACEVAP